MQPRLRVEVRDSVFNPDLMGKAKQVNYRKGEDGKALYQVWLYLTGEDLPYVKAVTYTLHPTFPDPVYRVERLPSNPDCRLIIWTWGKFDVKVAIEDKEGRLFEMAYPLTFGRQLEQEGIEFVLESEEPVTMRRPIYKGRA